MLISCPKCNSVYNISADKVPAGGKKFKCAECERIWTVYPEDVKNLEPDNTPVKPQMTTQQDSVSQKEIHPDVEEMFSRLSKDTKGLFNTEIDKDEGPFWKKWQRKIHVFMTPATVIGILFVVASTMALAVGYYNRYTIVGHIPLLENLYKDMNIESVYAGKDIKFEDVHIRHIEEQGRHFVEVSGALFNHGKYAAKLLPIKAVLKDSRGHIVCESVQDMPQNNLEPQFSAMFRLVLDNPTAEEKKLTLKLESNKGDNNVKR